MTKPPFEQFFAHRRLYPVAELTPDGERVLFVSNISGQFNLWSAELDGGWPEQLTTFIDNSVRGVAVREDGTILFHADRDGDEFHQLYRIPAEGGWPEQLTDLPQVQHELSPASWAPDGKSFAFSGNRRTPTDGEVYIWREGEAEPRYLFGEGMYTFAVSFSPDGSKLLAVEFRSNTDISIWVVDVASGEAVEATPHEGDAKFLPGPWKADGSGFYLLTDEGREFSGLAFHTLATNTREWIETPDHDIDELAGSADGRVLAWMENVDGWGKRARPRSRARRRPARAEAPAGHGFHARLRPVALPRRLAARARLGPAEPPGGGVRRRHRDRRRAARHRDARGGPVGARSARARAHPLRELRRPQIPAWLYRPDGDGPSPFALLDPRRPGGAGAAGLPAVRPVPPLPRHRRARDEHPRLDRLRQDVPEAHPPRLGRRRPRGLAARGRVAQGAAVRRRRPARASSAARTAASRRSPASPACPSTGAPRSTSSARPTSLTFVRAVPPQWLRFMAEWVGDPDTEEEFLRERSPITYVDQVQAALLVLQGAKDPRVVKSESDQMVERLRELGREVEYVVFEDEGHGFTRYANEVHAYRLTCEWLESHLS